jgi:hypothetical protein
MILDDHVNDLNILLFALRSVPGSDSIISELSDDITTAKNCIQEKKTIFKVYQNYFNRNNTPIDIQNHVTINLTDSCLDNVKKHVQTIINLIKPLNYPLPPNLLPKIDLNESKDMEPSLEFEIKLYSWMHDVIKKPMNKLLLGEFQKKEGLNELNFNVTDDFIGVLLYETIIDNWKYKDLRLNKTIDSILKEWSSPAGILEDLQITCKNEFLTLKNGAIIVSKKK